MTELVPSTASNIAAFLNAFLDGPDGPIRCLDAFPVSRPYSLSFCAKHPKIAPHPAPEGAVVLAQAGSLAALRSVGYAVIATDYPKYDLARAVEGVMRPPVGVGIHPSAVLDPDVEIGERVSIGPGCVLDGSIRIGDDCRLGANVCLMNDVTLGQHTRIRNGAVIGDDAYSFGFGPSGASVRMPSIGGVRIGARVEIGNNVVISRGIHRDTVLSDDTRVNSLANIGNTVSIGRNTLIMAHADLGGRVVIGEGCWLGSSAAIRQGVTVGDRALVGMGAVVIEDVPADVVVTGVPARIQNKS